MHPRTGDMRTEDLSGKLAQPNRPGLQLSRNCEQSGRVGSGGGLGGEAGWPALEQGAGG